MQYPLVNRGIRRLDHADEEFSGETSHAVEPVDTDSRRHGAAVYKDLRMTVALDGHAEVNSTDARTLIGTSSRAMRSNPNFGKNLSAVVVKR